MNVGYKFYSISKNGIGLITVLVKTNKQKQTKKGPYLPTKNEQPHNGAAPKLMQS